MPSPVHLHHGFVLLLKGAGVMLSPLFSFFNNLSVIIAAVVAKEL